MGAVAQRAEPGDVVGVQMGVDGLDQFEVELAHQLQIAIDPLQHRIDDQRLAAVPAGEQIGVGARGAESKSWRKIMGDSVGYISPCRTSAKPGAVFDGRSQAGHEHGGLAPALLALAAFDRQVGPRAPFRPRAVVEAFRLLADAIPARRSGSRR